ncbi:hypothetical protein FOL47_002443, partial [Perkinsus chesapeaki]
YEAKLEQITSVADELHAQLLTERSRHEKEINDLRAAHSAAIIEIRRTSVSQSEFDRVVARLTEQTKILKDKASSRYVLCSTPGCTSTGGDSLGIAPFDCQNNLQRVRDDCNVRFSLERMDLQERVSGLEHENGVLQLKIDELKIRSARGIPNDGGRKRSALVAMELEEVCKDLASRQKALNDLDSSLSARERKLLSREAPIAKKKSESFLANKDENRSVNEASSSSIQEGSLNSTTEKALFETLELQKIVEGILSMTLRSVYHHNCRVISLTSGGSYRNDDPRKPTHLGELCLVTTDAACIVHP